MANEGRQRQKDDPNQPTGTSGRQRGDANTDNPDRNDARRGETPPAARKRNSVDEDEDSALGNRTTYR